MSPRAPMTEEQKDVLRKRLADARAAKAAKAGLPKPPAPATQKVEVPTHRHDGLYLYIPWTERQWTSAPLDDCKQRLTLLRADFERGARMVGQRADVNDPTSYHCFVCKKPVQESKWAWKQDYLNPSTQLFESAVMCSQYCVVVYQNDSRMQSKMKDLINGRVSAAPESVEAQ